MDKVVFLKSNWEIDLCLFPAKDPRKAFSTAFRMLSNSLTRPSSLWPLFSCAASCHANTTTSPAHITTSNTHKLCSNSTQRCMKPRPCLPEGRQVNRHLQCREICTMTVKFWVSWAPIGRTPGPHLGAQGRLPEEVMAKLRDR